MYWWKEEIQKDEEFLMMLKTKTVLVGELTDYVRNNHPYEVAEVISVQIDTGNQPYLDWIAKSTK